MITFSPPSHNIIFIGEYEIIYNIMQFDCICDHLWSLVYHIVSIYLCKYDFEHHTIEFNHPHRYVEIKFVSYWSIASPISFITTVVIAWNVLNILIIDLQHERKISNTPLIPKSYDVRSIEFCFIRIPKITGESLWKYILAEKFNDNSYLWTVWLLYGTRRLVWDRVHQHR